MGRYPVAQRDSRRHASRPQVRVLIGAIGTPALGNHVPAAASKLPSLRAPDSDSKVLDTAAVIAGAPYTALRNRPAGACASAFTPVSLGGYGGSRYVAQRGQSRNDPTGDYTFDQALTAFHDARDAASYLPTTRTCWQHCAGRRIEAARAGDGPARPMWRLGEPRDVVGVLQLGRTLEDNPKWVCYRRLATRNNLVAHVMACGNSLADTTFAKLSGRPTDHIGGMQ